jgi:predicted metal-dependent peptidase
VFKHTVRCLSFWKENAQLANQAADYVVNDVIMNVADKAFIKLPAGGLYDPKFHNWAYPEVYRFLKNEQEQGGGGSRGNPLDDHDMSAAEEMTAEEIKKYADDIKEALHQGGLLASRFGKALPRSITEELQPQVDWRDALREFVTSVAAGNDEHTYRRFDKKMMAYDIIQPGVYSEKVGDIIVAIDVSGSIGQAQINEFATELQSICEQVTPDALRVIWWHDKVENEQMFLPEQFGDIRKLLKPNGTGGTYVTCVSDYITSRQLKADCVLVFTDGYVEASPKWEVNASTLWLVTRNKDFSPPSGMTVKIN